MNFRLETRAGVPTVVWDDGMCRSASGPEVELWMENERLREALRKYGRHLKGDEICNLQDDLLVSTTNAECTCGLEQALEVGDE